MGKRRLFKRLKKQSERDAQRPDSSEHLTTCRGRSNGSWGVEWGGRTSTLLQQQLHAPLVLLLLLREAAVRVQLCAIQGVLQPLHQPLPLVQLHLQLGQGQLELAFLLAQGHHLRE